MDNAAISYQVFDQRHLEQIMAVEVAAQSFPMKLSVLQSCLGKRYFNQMACVNGQLVGFYIGEHVAGETSLIEICVLPSHQGHGYGRALLSHFIDQANGLGAQSCWLEVRESNTAAQQLYLAMGFNELDRRKNYYPALDGREDALLMCLWL